VPQSEAEQLRNALTREVSNDAYAIAGQIFKGPEGDVARVSNDQLDARYRQAFASNDRSYLMAEAGRDPAQFMASMQRLGVQMPPDAPVETKPPLPQAAKANVPVPKPPASALEQLYPAPTAVPAPAPVVPPMVTPPAPVPVPPPTLTPPVAPPVPPPGASPRTGRS
jgi:hypothetical protein